MAGTRLAIHTIFFIQIAALIVFALYQIRDVLLVHRVVSTAGTLRRLLGDVSAFREGNNRNLLLFPVSIQLLVSPVLLQETFPKLQLLEQDGWKEIVTSIFQNYFDNNDGLEMQLTDIVIRSDESVVRAVPTICFGNLDQQQTYYELLHRNFTSTNTTVEQEYYFVLCPTAVQHQQQPKHGNFDILQLPHRDIIRIHLNVMEEMDRVSNDYDSTSATSFINSMNLSALLDSIFYPSQVGFYKGSTVLPPWFHLNFILMDQDLREVNYDGSPKQLQAILLKDFTNAIYQRFQPLSNQIVSTSLTQITMDVTTESFVSIGNDRDTFLMEERFTHRRNSRLLPFVSALHGVSEPKHLQYILYVASSHNRNKVAAKASSLPTCFDYSSGESDTTGVFLDKTLISTRNLQGYGSIWTWYYNTENNVTSNSPSIIMMSAVDSFRQNFLKEIAFMDKKDSSVTPSGEYRQRSSVPSPLLYQYEQYALQRFWLSHMFDFVIDEFHVLLEWLDHNPQIPISAQVLHKINLIEEKLKAAAQYLTLETGQVSLAMKQIQIATTLLEALKADGTMVESRYWLPNDQMLAVFCPLIVPLLAPLLIGCLREVKRYKKLTRSKLN